MWSLLQERQGRTWNLAGPDDSEEGYCTCWPAQIVDYRESYGTLTLALPEPDQYVPLHGEVSPLFGGWTEVSAAELLSRAVDGYDRFPPSGEPEKTVVQGAR